MQMLRPSPKPLILPRTLTRSPGTHGHVEDGQGRAPFWESIREGPPSPAERYSPPDPHHAGHTREESWADRGEPPHSALHLLSPQSHT